MSRPKKFIENLSTEELSALESAYKYGSSPDYRQRCKGILLSHQGYGVAEISEILSCSKLAVYQWLNKWEASGISGLQRKAGQGRPQKLILNDPTHIAVVKTVVAKHRQSSKAMLEEIKSTLQLEELSQRSLQRFLKKLVTDGSDSAED